LAGCLYPATAVKLPFLFNVSVAVEKPITVNGMPFLNLENKIRPVETVKLNDRRWGEVEILNQKNVTDNYIFISNVVSGPIMASHKDVEIAMERRNYDPSYFVNLYDYDFTRTNDNVDNLPKNWQITYYLQYVE